MFQRENKEEGGGGKEREGVYNKAGVSYNSGSGGEGESLWLWSIISPLNEFQSASSDKNTKKTTTI
jgi:hypothetical protein